MLSFCINTFIALSKRSIDISGLCKALVISMIMCEERIIMLIQMLIYWN